ncbi:MAG: DUF2336 domain-containing protein [Alphaproteobacteria bacterium]|nr:DUF2336 domain-containing protein [Alphaproteobacteria bacterium]
MLKKLLSRLPFSRKLPQNLEYETARAALEKNHLAQRTELAGRADSPPEMLYYLAGDESPKVRRKVAINPRTPIHADELLTGDRDDEVRCELARKIARLIPGLPDDAQVKLRERMETILEKLAADHLPRVRQIVAEEIRHSDNVPKRIALRLAKDLEAVVRAPILEYSPLLSDDDLLQIIASGIVDGATAPIARRREVSEPVSDAIVATLDVSAVAALLANRNAQIREETLDTIIEQAEDIHQWHRPIVMRPELPLRAVRRVAGFVASSLLTILLERKDIDLDAETSDMLRKAIRERINVEDSFGQPDELALGLNARQAHEQGQLNDASISAAATAHRSDYVIEGLGLRAGIPERIVRRIIDARSGKAITALV